MVSPNEGPHGRSDEKRDGSLQPSQTTVASGSQLRYRARAEIFLTAAREGGEPNFEQFRSTLAGLNAGARREVLRAVLELVVTPSIPNRIRIPCARILGEGKAASDPSLARLFRSSLVPEIQTVGMDLSNRILKEQKDPNAAAQFIITAWTELAENSSAQNAFIAHLDPDQEVVRALLKSGSYTVRFVGALFAVKIPDAVIGDLSQFVLNGTDSIAGQVRDDLLGYLVHKEGALSQFLRSMDPFPALTQVLNSIAWSSWCATDDFITQLSIVTRQLIQDRSWRPVRALALRASDHKSLCRVLALHLPLEPVHPRKILLGLLTCDDAALIDTIVARLQTSARHLQAATRFIARTHHEQSAIAVVTSLSTVMPLPVKVLEWVSQRALSPNVRRIASESLKGSHGHD